MRRVKWSVVMTLVVLAGLVACGSSQDTHRSTELSADGETIDVRSDSFSHEGTIPRRFTCDGRDISPPLSFGTVPEGANALAVIVEDPDAPRGTFDHWLAWNIRSTVDGLPENVPQGKTVEELGGIRQGKNGFGSLGYRGPCPPAGSTHRYVFTVYALDEPLSLSPGADKSVLIDAMEGHVLGSGELVGKYGR